MNHSEAVDRMNKIVGLNAELYNGVKDVMDNGDHLIVVVDDSLSAHRFINKLMKHSRWLTVGAGEWVGADCPNLYFYRVTPVEVKDPCPLCGKSVRPARLDEPGWYNGRNGGWVTCDCR